MRRCATRRGFATVLALLFIVLFLALWAVAYRETAALLRMDTVQSNRIQRDQGCTQAVAVGLTLLETGQPPASPYSGTVTINTPTGPQSFVVTVTEE